jgi:hypothetical protein
LELKKAATRERRQIRLDNFMGYRLTKNGLEHFDVGGAVIGGQAPSFNSGLSLNGVAANAGATLGTIGGAAQGLASDFTAQNGYQAQLAPTTSFNYAPTVGSASANSLAGYAQYNQNLNHENQLAQALYTQSQGGGPNPAQAMLNNSTGANVANTAANIAGARGASGNVGLMARQAANAGAGIQQNAIGQGAALNAQQQLGAQGALSSLYGQQGSQIQGEQNANTALYGAAAGANNAQNNTNVSNYGQMQNINSGVAAQNASATNNTLGGFLGAGGSAVGALLAKGGTVPKPGGKIALPAHLKSVVELYHPHMLASGGFIQVGNYAVPEGGGVAAGMQGAGGGLKSLIGGGGSDSDAGGGGAGGALAGMGAGMEAKGGEINISAGGKVPGKAAVKGNSYSNDTTLAMVSPGEIVIPRSITQGENAPEKAAAFVAKELAKHGKGKGADADDFKQALKKAMLARKKA